jgi:hypothetical protein
MRLGLLADDFAVILIGGVGGDRSSLGSKDLESTKY